MTSSRPTVEVQCIDCEVSYQKRVDGLRDWSGRCRDCATKGADHPELRFDHDNCRTLCMSCHYVVTFDREMPEGTVWGHNPSRRAVS